MIVEQQRLGFVALGISRKPIIVGAFLKDNWHAAMDMRDMLDGGRRDDGTAGHAQIVVVRPQPRKTEWPTIRQLQQPRVFLAVLGARGPLEIAIGRDEAAPLLERFTEGARGVDRFNPGVEHRGCRQFLGEERHQPPPTAVQFDVSGLVVVDEIDRLGRRDVEARLHVGRGWRRIVNAIEGVDFGPGQLIGEAAAQIFICPKSLEGIELLAQCILEWMRRRDSR